MVCEELQTNFENAMDAWEAAVEYTQQLQQSQQGEMQQAQWAESALMGAAMMAWWLLEICLNGQNGLAAISQALKETQKALSSPETAKAKISEMRRMREKLKAVK